MSRGVRFGWVGLLAVSTVILVGGCPWPGGLSGADIDVAVGVRAARIAFAGEVPGAVAIAPDGRVFYTERATGRIRVIKEGSLLADIVAEVPVNAANDRGALGLAFHPNFTANSRLYLFYSRSSTGQTTIEDAEVSDHRVVYFVLDGDVASGGEFFVASMPATGAGRRVGGRIAFGADSQLYVALGDQGDDNAAKDSTSLSGKVLRYTPDGGIPASNPTAGSPVFARGFRHPLGLAVDPLGGGIFLIDRNDGRLHEINRVSAGGFYGWPDVAGLLGDAERATYLAANPDYVDPMLDSGSDSAAYTGLAFSSTSKYGASLASRLVYGVSTRGQLYAATLSTNRDAIGSADLFAAGFPNDIMDVAVSESGVLHVATTQNIYRLDTFP